MSSPFSSPGEFFTRIFLIATLTTGISLLSLIVSDSLIATFLTWLLITFNFPLIQIPERMGPLLLGSAVSWGSCFLWYFPTLKNRRIFHKLPQPGIEGWAIVFALTMVLIGLIFRSIVPNPVFHLTSFLQGFFGLFLDKQLGLLSYAPLYLLAPLGLGILFREGSSKKFLALVPALLVYGLNCLIRYGFPASPFSAELVKPFNPEDIIPFLPILGGLLALFLRQVLPHSHTPTLPRSHTSILFSWPALLLLLVNVCLIGVILLKYPEIPSLIGKFRNFQVDLAEKLGRDLLFFYPNLASESTWLAWGLWFIALGISIALGYRYVLPITVTNHEPRMRNRIFKSLAVVGILLLVGTFLFQQAPRRHTLSMEYPLLVSANNPYREIVLEEDPIPSSKSFILVSSLANSIGFPQGNGVAVLTLQDGRGEEESFSIIVGEHTSEWAFEDPDSKRFMAHNQAMIYNSRITRIRRGPWFEAHRYYTQLDLKKPLKIKKITLRFISPPGFKLPDSVLRIEEFILFY